MNSMSGRYTGSKSTEIGMSPCMLRFTRDVSFCWADRLGIKNALHIILIKEFWMGIKLRRLCMLFMTRRSLDGIWRIPGFLSFIPESNIAELILSCTVGRSSNIVIIFLQVYLHIYIRCIMKQNKDYLIILQVQD